MRPETYATWKVTVEHDQGGTGLNEDGWHLLMDFLADHDDDIRDEIHDAIVLLMRKHRLPEEIQDILNVTVRPMVEHAAP